MTFQKTILVITINVLAGIAANAQISGPNFVCPGTSGVYEYTAPGGGIPFGNYSWYLNNVYQPSAGNSYQAAITFPSSGVSHIVAVEFDPEEVGLPNESDDITVYLFNPGTIVADAATVCYDANVNITVSDYSGTISWQRKDGSGAWYDYGFGNAITLHATNITQSTSFRTVMDTNGSCGLIYSNVVTVGTYPIPTASAGDASICSGQTTSVSINGYPNNVSGTTFTWNSAQYSGATVSGHSSGSGSPIAQALSVSGAQGVVRYSIYPVANGCPGTGINIYVTVKPVPYIAGLNQTICSESQTSVSITSNLASTSLNWTVTPTGNVSGASASSTTTPTTITQTLTNFSTTQGSVTYNITPTKDGCAGPPLYPVVIVNPKPTTANAGPDQTSAATCGLTSVTLAGNIPAAGSGSWSVVSGSGAFITDPSAYNSPFSGIAGNTYVLRWTITNSPCTPSTDDVAITFNRYPTVANAGPDQTGSSTCGLTSVTLAANVPGFGSGSWSIISGSGGSIGTPSANNSSFSGVAGSTYVLRWTISNSPCTASTDDVSITFNRNPTTSNAGPDQTGSSTCGLTSVTLAGNSPSIGTGAWSIISGSGGSIDTPSANNSSFTGVYENTYVLRWTISNSPCTASTDDVTVTFNRYPTTSNAGPDQIGFATCGSTSATLAGNAPSIGNGSWSIVSGTGGSILTPSASNSVFNGIAGSTYVLHWTISNSPCTPSIDDVIVTFNQNPTNAEAGPDQVDGVTCGLTMVTLAATPTSIGEKQWSIVSGTGGYFGTPGTTTSTNPGAAFSGVAGNSYVLRWTTSNAPCTPSTDDVTITFNQNPTPAIAGPDQTGTAPCEQFNVTLAANTNSAGNQAWSIVNGTGGSFNDAASPGTIFTVVPGIPYTLRWTTTNSPCSPSYDDVNINFSLKPIITSSASRVYMGSEAILSAGNCYDTYAWKNIQNSVVATTPTFTTNISGTYKVEVTKSEISGTSDNFHLAGQLDDISENYIVASILLQPGIAHSAISYQPVENVSQTIQYFDGLGRGMQSISTQASPSKQDIVQPIVYDAFGREAKKYLPFAAQNNGWYKPNHEIINVINADYTGIASNFYNNPATKITDDQNKPFSETIFEPSPMNRVQKQGSPGASWQPDDAVAYTSTDHSIKFAYDVNSANEVLRWTVSYPLGYPFGLVNAGTAAAPIYYSANQLYKNKTKDENGFEVIEYKDKQGRAVLKRVQVVNVPSIINDTNYASTYYVYDDFGNVVCVIPPEATRRVTQISPASEYFRKSDQGKDNFLARWAFRYVYDARRRVVQKQMPGTQPVYMVYDNRDRLVMTQDGNQRATVPQYWTFTKYDELNRPILTGIKDTTGVSQETMQAVVDAHYTKTWARWGDAYIGNVIGNIHGYTNRSYPVTTSSSSPNPSPNRFLTVTYFDNYAFKSILRDSAVYRFDNAHSSGQDQKYFNRLVGQVTGSRVKILDGGITGASTWLNTINYYDDHYRIIQVVSDNYKEGTDRATTVYDFTGKPLTVKTTHTRGDVIWKDQVGTTVFGNRLVCGSQPMAGAASIQQLAAGQNGYFEFVLDVVSSTNKFYIGFNDTNPDVTFTNIDYAIRVNNATLQIIENNVIKVNLTNLLKTGDVLKIERIGTSIKYYRNGNLVYTSAAASSGALLIDVSFQAINATLTGVRTSFSMGSQTLARRFEYDHTGRLLKTWHKTNNEAEILLVKNEYNELGQVIDKKLHSTLSDGSNAKQSVDYRYNVRGWLSSINNSALENEVITNDDSGDLFGMDFSYDEPVSGLTASTDTQFNGNISAISWSNHLALGEVKERGYKFVYDPLNRLKGATQKEKTSAWSASTAFHEDNLTYDLNGNIKTLNRSDADGSAMDVLTYYYGAGTSSGNKLLYVTDSGNDQKGFAELNAPGNDYTYDANGNLRWDRNKAGVEIIPNGNFDNGSEGWTAGGETSRLTFDNNGLQVSNASTNGVTLSIAGVVAVRKPYVVVLNIEKTFGSGTITVNVGGITVTHSTTGEQGFSVTSGTTTIFTVSINDDFVGKVNSISLRGVTAIAYNYLNLPELVTRASDDELRYIYDATGRKLVQVLKRGNTVKKRSDYVGEYFYENDTLQFITHDEGRIVMGGGKPEYQYHLKDHLGNVRLTFTTKTDAEVDTATFETSHAVKDQSKFLRYQNARRIQSTLFDHTNGSSTAYSERLNGSANEKYGLARSLSVMPGDTVKLEVFAKYVDTNSGNWTQALATFLTAISNNTAPAGTVVDGGGYSSSTSSFSHAGLLNTSASSGAGPKAFINWLIFDRDYVLKDGGYVRIPESAKETGTDIAHAHLSKDDILIKEPGYVYIYLSNENETPVEVFFDDFKVEHVKSPVVQMDDYYPFGLTSNSYQRENSTPNKFKFQGQEHIDDLNLGWDSFKWRNHQPEIGRFFKVDPLAEKYVHNSPYAFSENKVVVHVELEGLESVYIFDQAARPQDNGTAGTTYTADVYVVNDDNGTVGGPYSGSSYPNSISNTNNNTNSNTLNTGEHQYNNESGHSGGTKQGLNIVNANGVREAPGTDPNGNAVTMTLVNAHEGKSDNGNYNSRGSEGCITIAPADAGAFFGNFDWSGSSGNTGNSSGTMTVHRGDTETAKLDKLKVELLQVTIDQLGNGTNGTNQN